MAITEPRPIAGNERSVTLHVNGEDHRISIHPGVTLLDALGEKLGLYGTKKGCDHGQCGACTVHIDGRRVLACLTLAAAAEGAEILTIEGLADGEELHPMQAAFVECDALQCGYCTAGQIMSAIGAVEEGGLVDERAIAEAMSGNICRCGAYPMIRKAVERARV
jgi:xanthine dehydrogenase YagT iron-sulfur-binding subunit